MRPKQGDKHTDILDAAIVTFQSEGFAKATVASIAKQAGVATGSVYLYFQGKDDVLDQLFTRFWLTLLEDIQALSDKDPAQFLQAQLACFFDRLTADRNFAEVYLREHHQFLQRKPEQGFAAYLASIKLGEQAFTRGVRAGIFASGFNVSLGRSFLFGGVRAAIEFWLGQDALSAKQVRDRTLRMAMASLSKET